MTHLGGGEAVSFCCQLKTQGVNLYVWESVSQGSRAGEFSQHNKTNGIFQKDASEPGLFKNGFHVFRVWDRVQTMEE